MQALYKKSLVFVADNNNYIRPARVLYGYKCTRLILADITRQPTQPFKENHFVGYSYDLITYLHN